MTTDGSPPLLIFSSKVDIATDHVILKLEELSASFYRINSEDFPLGVRSSLTLDPSEMPDREQSQRDLVRDKAEFPKLTTEDGLVILGEYSKVKRLEWELPTVVMQTMVAPAGSEPDDDRESFFPR